MKRKTAKILLEEIREQVKEYGIDGYSILMNKNRICCPRILIKMFANEPAKLDNIFMVPKKKYAVKALEAMDKAAINQDEVIAAMRIAGPCGQYRATCGLCVWRGPSRADRVSATMDAHEHSCFAHRSPVRDLNRKYQLNQTEYLGYPAENYTKYYNTLNPEIAVIFINNALELL